MGLPNVALLLDTYKSYGRGVLRGVKRWVRLHRAWNLFTEANGRTIRIEDLRNWKGQGAIGQFGAPDTAEALAAQGIAVVSVSNRLPIHNVPAIFTDDRAVGRLVADHYLDRGFKNFAFVGFNGFIYSEQRKIGMRERLVEKGFALTDCNDLPIVDDYIDLQKQLDAFIDKLPKPVAILGANDVRAKQVTLSARNLGLRVPQDVAVVGVDNDDLQIELADVPISSVELATETIGYNAAATLARLLAGDWVSKTPILIPPIGVVMRESSDVIAVKDEEVAHVLRFIQENWHREVEVPEVAGQAGISRRVLEMRFKAATGRTLQEEIWRVHVERAKGLLIETDLPMPEIAEKSGFPSASRLSSVFRRETSMTPTKYRRLYRQH